MGGLKDAGKIVGAGLAEMFGDKTQISTINAANMLSYTGDANLGIAKDIWDENINVEYRELKDDNGLYTHSTNTITLSSKLLGGGKEESAKLATVMAHEGSHANGVNVEALAHANGLQTYSAINTMFGLNGDKNFSNQMLAGIMAPENWKENTGDVEHWKMTWGGQLISDGDGWLKNADGKYINIDGSLSDTPIEGQTLGANGIETGLLNIVSNSSNRKYESFNDDEIKAVQALMMAEGTDMKPSNPNDDFKKYKWGDNPLGQKLNMTDFMKIADVNVNEEIFKTYYNNTVDNQIAKLLGIDLGYNTEKTIPVNQIGNYAELLKTRLTDYISTGNAKQTLTEKYFQTIDTKDGESINFYKLDKNNPFLDKVLGQHDITGEKYKELNNSGCNFMCDITVPQLLTGIVFNEDTVKNIWNVSIKNSFVQNDGTVDQPDYVSDYAWSYTKYANIENKFDSRSYIKNYDAYIIAKRYELKTDLGKHFVIGYKDSIIYNPGYSTGKITSSVNVFVRSNK